MVLVIVAVLLSAMSQSFRFGGSDQLRSEQAKIRGLLQVTSDAAAFEGRPYLLVPTEQGLQPWHWSRGQWFESEKLANYSTPSELQMSWQLEESKLGLLNLPAKGWLFLPNGEVSPGEIALSFKEANRDAVIRVLEWDTSLNFSQ